MLNLNKFKKKLIKFIKLKDNINNKIKVFRVSN